MEAFLTRVEEEAGATRGRLYIPGIGMFHTLELPWRDNKPNISCIPLGRYFMQPHGWPAGSTVKFKSVWEVTNVPGRKAILIHSGNTVDDIQGCILVGQYADYLHGKPAVTSSRTALDVLRRKIGEQSWNLTIQKEESKNGKIHSVGQARPDDRRSPGKCCSNDLCRGGCKPGTGVQDCKTVDG